MKIIIIGGGISGLTAGIYARKNGFETVILEQHSTIGGECTGWNRKGYHIDGCIHWMTGTNPGNVLNDLWRETGALDGIEIIKPNYLNVYEKDNISLTVWRDIDRFRADMITISPEDGVVIDEFFTAVRGLRKMKVPSGKPFELMNPFELTLLGFSMMKVGMIMNKYSKISVKEFSDQFKSDFLRSFFCDSLRGEVMVSSLMFMIAAFCFGIADIPRGGSLAMAKRMEERYLSLGGTVRVKSPVRKILVEDGAAVGVELDNGEVVRADYIIPSCDIHITKELLQNRYPFPEYDVCDLNPIDYAPTTCVYIALGIADPCKEIPERIIFDCEPYIAGVTQMNSAGIKTYPYENFAPEGHTVAVSYIDQRGADSDYWINLYKNKESYKQAKDTLAAKVVCRLEKRWPSLSGKIEVLDVATPATYNRYTGAYKGSWMTYMLTPKAKNFIHNGRISGLRNLYLSGQWLQPPGGLPTAVTHGKFAVQRLCADLRRKFIGVR